MAKRGFHYNFPDVIKNLGGGMKRNRLTNSESENEDDQRVVEVTRLPQMSITEADLLDVFRSFGSVAYVLVLPGTGMAFVEFEESESARLCVSYAQHNPVFVGNSDVTIKYSLMKVLERNGIESSYPSPVIVATITNVNDPVRADTIFAIAKRFGRIMRISVLREPTLQAMIEYDCITAAKAAKHGLNGAEIWANSCSLKVEFARIDHLEVSQNDDYHWDSTIQTGQSLQNTVPWPGTIAGVPADFGSNLAVAVPAQEAPFQGWKTTAPMSLGPKEGAGFLNRPNRNKYREGRWSRDDGIRGRLGPKIEHYPTDEPSGGRVVIITGLDRSKMNCDCLFNLLCQYGNVAKVLFLKTRTDAALVEMGNAEQAACAIAKLKGYCVFGSVMNLKFSDQSSLRDVRFPFRLPDGSPSFINYQNNRNQRFNTPEMAAKNRMIGPSKIIHFFNAPPTITEECIRKLLFTGAGLEPISVRLFPAKSIRSQSGICEFESVEEALEAIAKCCHLPVDSPCSQKPFIIKFTFFAG